MKILFVCSANVGRSQMAEGYYNHLTGSTNAHSAAGIERLREKYADSPHPLVSDLMAQEGIDISHQQITYLDEIDINEFDQIVAFCNPSDCVVDLSSHKNVRYIHIEDPAGLGTTDDQFRKRLEHSQYAIKQAIHDLIGI